MKLYQVDAFTTEVFKGNPAAVCILDDELSDPQMQQIALEMNLSETAFVDLKTDPFGLRWFTPAKEVPLCGHATLASSFVLFNEGLVTENHFSFETLSGILKISQNKDGSISMDFPANVPIPADHLGIGSLEELFDCEVEEILTIPNELIVILKDADCLKRTAPDMGMIAKSATNGVIVSAWQGGAEYDFVSRYFAPNLGIPEDPVTGFMHTILTPYWAQKKGQNSFKALQASSRTGNLDLELMGERVVIRGNAVKVFETELHL